MKTRSAHPLLVGIPIALYALTLIAFAVYQWANADAFWYRLGYVANMAGVAMAIVAAIPGAIDFNSLPARSEARARGIVHMSLNLLALVLFATSAWLIRNNWNIVPDRVGAPLLLAFTGVALTAAAGYYGWQLAHSEALSRRSTDLQHA